MTTAVYKDVVDNFVFYNTKQQIPIDDVIKSLQAYKELVGFLPKTIHKLLDIEVESIDVYVDDIQSGSLKSWMLLALNFKDEEELKKWVQQKPMARYALLSLLIAGLVSYGMVQLQPLLSSSSPVNNTNSSDNGSLTVIGNNNVIIQTTADLTDKTKHDVETAISEATHTARKKLAENAIKFIQPAKRDKDASVYLYDHSKLDNTKASSLIQHAELPKEFIAAAPEYYEPVKQIDHIDMESAEVTLHAKDKDNGDKGWLGSVDGIDGSRIKLEFIDDIDHAQYFNKSRLKARVQIEYRYDSRANQMKPKRITILEVQSAD